MRELPPQDELLKEFDHAPIITLPPDGWYCIKHDQPLDDVMGTVDWIDGPTGLPFGRCRLCGQKYDLPLPAVDREDVA